MMLFYGEFYDDDDDDDDDGGAENAGLENDGPNP